MDFCFHVEVLREERIMMYAVRLSSVAHIGLATQRGYDGLQKLNRHSFRRVSGVCIDVGDLIVSEHSDWYVA